MMLDRIGNFRPVRIVSEGTHEVLLHAVSEKSGERVAVRIVRGEAATQELELRCQRAVDVSRLLAHPAVVRLIQAGRLPDGSVYQVQEQLIGETLAGRIAARRRLPANELLRLVRQIATVLSVAHARGIVHRALRPESVQLIPDRQAVGGERVKLNDWGLAVVPAHGEQPAQVPPVPLDSPTYLAPELCRAGAPADPATAPRRDDASSESADERIDVYELGVMLFQLASGHPPFAEQTASAVIAMHISAPPPKLDRRNLGLPRGLPELVTAMLSKDAKARPPMHEVEERLVQLLADQQLAPTLTPASSKEDVTQKFPSTNATLQFRLPQVGNDSFLPGRWSLAVAFALPVTIVVGMWWLYTALFSARLPTAPIMASAVSSTSSASEGLARPITGKSVEALARERDAVTRAMVLSLARIPPLRDGSLASAGERPQVHYPPLRDGSLPQASVLSRLNFPPLRDGKAIAMPGRNRRRRFVLPAPSSAPRSSKPNSPH